MGQHTATASNASSRIGLVLSLISAAVSLISLNESCEAHNFVVEKTKPLVYSNEARLREACGDNEPPRAVLCVGKPIVAAARLTNYGEGAARNITTDYTIELIPAGTKINWPISQPDHNEWPILANHDWTDLNTDTGRPLSAAELKAIADEKLIIYLRGTSVYSGVPEPKEPVRWCWKYKPRLAEFWRCDAADLKS